MKNTRLVYSTDPKDQAKMDAEKNPPQEAVTARKFVVIFRLEKKGRGGKTVTVLDGLPKNEIFLKDLTKGIKAKCGVGGTYSMSGKEGLIEIQGDKREQIKKLLEAKQIKYKGV